MTKHKIGVGIVGLQPGRSWAAVAHLPALRYLSEHYKVIGVANSSLESGLAAAAECNIPRAFSSIQQMTECEEVDVIAVTVKVPAHWEILQAAVMAGKHVYCEWPLGIDLAQAQALAQLAADNGVKAVIGTQARVTPVMRQLRELVGGGFVGDVLSTSVSGWGRIWGDTVENLATDGYLLDKKNGATMLTIPFAHTLSALRDVLGDVVEVSAMLETRRKKVMAVETGKSVDMDAPDQILVTGRLASGATLSMHYQGGEPRGIGGFVWDIHGTQGDIRVTADTGHTQIMPLTIMGAQGEDRTLQQIAAPEDDVGLESLVPGNVARIYQRLACDLRYGTQTAPSFEDAVALHTLLDAIEQASESGQRITVNAPNRILP
jgi:predicted dehydrogenase